MHALRSLLCVALAGLCLAGQANAGVYTLPRGETIADALLKLGDARVIELPAGFTVLGDTATGHKTKGPGETTEVTIRPACGVPRGAVTLGFPAAGGLKTFRSYCRVRYEDVRIDFGSIAQFYGGVIGFDRCEWCSSAGWEDTRKRATPVRGPYYFRGGVCRDMVFGPLAATEVSDSHVERISGDVFQANKLIRDVTIDNVDGSILSRHTDLFQDFAASDGVTIERVKATNVGPAVQPFMFESFIGRGVEGAKAAGSFHPDYTIRNLTVRDVTIEYAPGVKPPVSHFMGYFDACLFENVSSPSTLLFRQQFAVGGCRDVVIRGGDLPAREYPEGVTIE